MLYIKKVYGLSQKEITNDLSLSIVEKYIAQGSLKSVMYIKPINQEQCIQSLEQQVRSD
ncbi:MAG: hypothetical protein ACI9U5_002037 [Colwellia sp.]|jgi:hypothetical protein